MTTRFAFKPMLLLLVFASGIVFAGCAGGNSNADLDRGRQLFAANCAACHVLAQSGSTGQLGPDLDMAFAAAREAGMDEATIHGVVERQIGFPRPADESDSFVYMPADIVTGNDARDVSAYIASVAGVEGIEPPKVPGPPGAQIFFDNGCAGCHTLAVAGAGGTTGPDLDDVLPGASADFIRESLVNPDADIASGYSGGVMPSYASMSDDDLKELIQYLMDCTGPDPADYCTETPDE